MSEAPTFHGGPLPFITISPSGECVVEEYAAKILSQIKGRIAVITVAGLYRTGKSFLMNRLIGMQDGFEIGPTVNPCTKGIWIWGQPVQLGEDYYAILIDTEGLGSGNDSKTDVTIFTLAVLLSSYFIYNSMGAISEDTLDQLSLVTSVVKAVTGKAGDVGGGQQSSGPPLLWVLRDFNLKLQNEFNQIVSPKDYLENCLRPMAVPAGSSGAAAQSVQQKNAIRESIKNLFIDRDCLTMIRPVESEAELRQINKVPFESLRTAFKQQIESFVERVYTTIEPKRVGQVYLNGATFSSLVAQYCAILNGSQGSVIPGLHALAWDNVVQTQLRASLREAVGLYRAVLNEDGMKRLPLTDSQLRSVHLKAKAAAKAAFPTALLSSLKDNAADVSFSGGDPNLSLSQAADVSSPSLFYREFRIRREQLMEHLKSENQRVSAGELERIFNELVKQVIDPSTGSVALLLESWRTVLASLEQQCGPKYPSSALSQFIAKTFVPSMIAVSVSSLGNVRGQEDLAAERRKWTEKVFQLEAQLEEKRMALDGIQQRSVRDLAGSQGSVNSLWEMVRQLQEKLAIAEQTAAVAKSLSGDSPIGGPQSASVTQELRQVKDLVVTALSGLKSGESEKRAIEAKAENERNMIELERRFTKQLNEARRRNEMMIDDLKQNYEQELNNLKAQKQELQDMVRELDKEKRVKDAELDKMATVIQATENDKTLRANLANVINQQSELVLQFLRQGAQMSNHQANELARVSGQAAELKNAQRPPLLGKFSSGA